MLCACSSAWWSDRDADPAVSRETGRRTVDDHIVVTCSHAAAHQRREELYHKICHSLDTAALPVNPDTLVHISSVRRAWAHQTR